VWVHAHARAEPRARADHGVRTDRDARAQHRVGRHDGARVDAGRRHRAREQELDRAREVGVGRARAQAGAAERVEVGRQQERARARRREGGLVLRPGDEGELARPRVLEAGEPVERGRAVALERKLERRGELGEPHP
jgi:hypothetical protein